MTAAPLVDLVIALTVLEGVALTVFHHRTGRGVAPGALLPNLLAGLLLTVALRAALGGAAWPWIAACLAAAGLAHAADLRRRWPRPLSAPPSGR